MGLFHFLDLSSVRAAEHNVSFDLTIAPSSRRIPVARIPPLPAHPTKRVPIPLEIVLNILEAAYYDEDHLDDHHHVTATDQLLYNCSLVCRYWSAPAQKLLFRRVTLRDEVACAAFTDAVDRSTERGRILGDAVVRLRVVLDYNQPRGISAQAFAHAVARCPHLYQLSIGLHGGASFSRAARSEHGGPSPGPSAESRSRRAGSAGPSLDEHTLNILRSGPRITALEVGNWTEDRQVLAQLLDVWPTVRCLTVSGVAPQVPSSSSSSSSSASSSSLTAQDPVFLPNALQELRMNVQTGLSVEVMKWLLHRSVGALRVLELEREPSGEVLEYVVDAHGATLHALALPVCGSHEHALAVQRCGALRELRVESAWVSPMVYRKLPPGMQHVALGLDADTALQPVLELVRGGGGDRGRRARARACALRAVTVQVWEGGEQHPQLAPLKMACAFRGVELKLTHDVREFRALVRGDPVSTTCFPRVKCLENLRRMRFGA